MKKLVVLILFFYSLCFASALDSLFYHDGFDEAMKVIEQNENIPFEKRSVTMNKIIFEYALLSDSCLCKYTPANGLDNDTLFHKLFNDPELYADVIGKNYLFYSRYTEAIYYFTNYMISTKRTPELLLLRGFAHYNANHYDEAEQDFYTAKLFEESESSNESILSIANASMALAKLTKVNNEYPGNLCILRNCISKSTYKSVIEMIENSLLGNFDYRYRLWEKLLLLECYVNIGYLEPSFEMVKSIEIEIETYHQEVGNSNIDELTIILPIPNYRKNKDIQTAPLLLTYSLMFLSGKTIQRNNSIYYLFSLPINDYLNLLNSEICFMKSEFGKNDLYDHRAREYLIEVSNSDSNISYQGFYPSITGRIDLLNTLLMYEESFE